MSTIPYTPRDVALVSIRWDGCLSWRSGCGRRRIDLIRNLRLDNRGANVALSESLLYDYTIDLKRNPLVLGIRCGRGLSSPVRKEEFSSSLGCYSLGILPSSSPERKDSNFVICKVLIAGWHVVFCNLCIYRYCMDRGVGMGGDGGEQRERGDKIISGQAKGRHSGIPKILGGWGKGGLALKN